MSYKETSRDVEIERSSYPVDKHSQSLFKSRLCWALFDCHIEESLDICERILIHRIYSSKVSNHEVKYAATSSHRAIGVTSLIDLLLNNLG